jgi:hypothetical protein
MTKKYNLYLGKAGQLVCRERKWSDILIISRTKLEDFYLNQRLSSTSQGNLTLHFAFHDGKVTCNQLDFTEFNHNFEDFPIIPH